MYCQLTEWLIKKITEQNEITRLQLPLCSPGEILVGLLDSYLPFVADPLNQKRRQLMTWKSDWARHQSQDKDFDWYVRGGSEKQKCEMAWMWYCDNHPREIQLSFKFSKLADVLGFLDGSKFTQDEKRYHLEQIKKKFKSRKIQDSRRGKTQTNLSLSDEMRAKLDQLAHRERMSKTEIIELLIQGAHERGLLN